MVLSQICDSHITEPYDQVGIQLQLTPHLLAPPTWPEPVVITSDCTNNGRPTEYKHLSKLLRPLPMLVYAFAANHDGAELVAGFGTQSTQLLGGFAQYVVDAKPLWHVALDTTVQRQHEGTLCTERSL